MHFKKLAGRCGAIFAATVLVTMATSAVAQAQLAAPKLRSPSNHARVQALPAFTWKAVNRAASYQFEFSANGNFSSSVSGWSAGPMSLHTTAITNTSAISNGTYFWRVRAVSASDVPGRWSTMRKLTKRWSKAPKLTSPVTTPISWPAMPLLMKWTAVPYAVNYQVEIGTSSSLSTLVYGPQDVQGLQFAVPKTLSPGTYYWAVRPMNASGQLGARSVVRSFSWKWPSNTSLTETDASPDATYEEANFSWTPIAGASSYELQVATNPAYANDSIILDATGLLGNSYTPTSFLPNHTTLYWRVRALDANKDAGSWNTGEEFTESFDTATPSILNLHVVDQNGNTVDGDTNDDNPIVRWSPVPGASAYNVTLVPWISGSGCNFNGSTHTISTSVTAWTPWGTDDLNTWESSEYQWPSIADDASAEMQVTSGSSYCIDVIAYRSASPLAGSTIESAPTVIGSLTAPAFTYEKYVPAGTLTSPTTVDYSPGIVQPAAGAGALSQGSTITTTPLFEWQPVADADGYYIVIANDASFDPNSILFGGYTNTTSWAPPRPIPDQTGAFWWEVLPVNAAQAPFGTGSAQDGTYDPQHFNKSSAPPAPVSPVGGANVPTQPTFSWRSAQGAVSYTLQISTDPTFANPIQNVTTDSTEYTSSSTLPAGKTLYWRVRANDVAYNLNWSPTETFTHNVPAPTSPTSRPRVGATVPLMSWKPVTGATGYNVEVTSGQSSYTIYVTTPFMTPTELPDPGISTWHVQAVFPGSITSAFTTPATNYKRTFPAPTGVHATKSGTRILVTWRPDPLASHYNIEVSTTPGFESSIASGSTANTAWVPQLTAQQETTKLYWRLQAVDTGNNGSAYDSGVFKPPAKHHKATKKTAKKKKKSKKK